MKIGIEGSPMLTVKLEIELGGVRPDGIEDLDWAGAVMGCVLPELIDLMESYLVSEDGPALPEQAAQEGVMLGLATELSVRWLTSGGSIKGLGLLIAKMAAAVCDERERLREEEEGRRLPTVSEVGHA